MSLENLKSMNKPDNSLNRQENMLNEYQIKVPFYGVPPEVLNTLVRMMTEVAKYQAPMQEQINHLPTWEDWEKSIQPTVSRAMNGHTHAVQACESNLKRAFNNQTQTITRDITSSLIGKITKLEKTLQARDNTPSKRQLQWMGIGALIPIILSGLWWLLNTFWI